MQNEFLIGFIGIISTCFTQLIIHLITRLMENERNKDTSIIAFIEPLKIQISDNCEKLKQNRARKKVKMKKNSIRWIEGKVIKEFSDIRGNQLDWFYRHGANLGTTCYLLSCLIAYAHHVKQHMPFKNFKKEDRNQIIKYINELNDILKVDSGIFHIVQYDLGRIMFTDTGCKSLISYKQFCSLVLSEEEYEYCSFIQVFNFILNIANDERVNQCDQLIQHLERFNSYLDSLY